MVGAIAQRRAKRFGARDKGEPMSFDAETAAHSEAATDFERAQASTPFQELKRRQRSFVFPLAVAFLLWYFAYVLLADYAHDLMSTRVIGNVNIGLLLGLAQFVTTFVITTWYVSHANRELDPLADAIRHDLAAGAHTDSVNPNSADTDSSNTDSGVQR
jgi:uncharacterized membrane protein (DUF485 family)